MGIFEGISDGALEGKSDARDRFWIEDTDGLIEGTEDGVSEGLIDGKSEGMVVGLVSTRSLPVVPAADRVDPLLLLSLEFIVETIRAHKTAIVIAMIANDFFIDQAIFPFVVSSKEWRLSIMMLWECERLRILSFGRI